MLGRCLDWFSCMFQVTLWFLLVPVSLSVCLCNLVISIFFWFSSLFFLLMLWKITAFSFFAGLLCSITSMMILELSRFINLLWDSKNFFFLCNNSCLVSIHCGKPNAWCFERLWLFLFSFLFPGILCPFTLMMMGSLTFSGIAKMFFSMW